MKQKQEGRGGVESNVFVMKFDPLYFRLRK